MSKSSQAPPSYHAASSSSQKYPQYGATSSSDPLLGEARERSSSDNHDIPDDFKHGVTVSESTLEIRQAFVRKVYSILFAQILGTFVVGWFTSSEGFVAWIENHRWAIFIPLFGSFMTLVFMHWKRHSHPVNYLLLAFFTLFESWSLGLIVSYYENVVVLQALLITVGVFLGLTLFTLQSKYDFSGMGPYLFGGLLVLLMTGIVGIFVPFGKTMDLIYSCCGCFIFCGYIVFDTYIITKRLSPDKFIMGAVSLYLDLINLFVYVLGLLKNRERQ